ncbi:ribose-phosphate pyrophosphokinase [Pseudomonas phage PA1C]|nr:ribose-phosphate pyrophosphokinase [Pseudomonas phage PA1C]
MIRITQLHGNGLADHYDCQPFKFPGGEIGIKIPLKDLRKKGERFIINAWLRNSDDIMELFLVFDAIRRQRIRPEIHLVIGYLPYARQDRVCDEGEPLSISVMTGLINALDATSVCLYDPHSNVSLPLINNCREITQADIIKSWVCVEGQLLENPSDWWLVAPDEGARKKTEAIAKEIGAAGVLYACKNRELSTGKITHTSLLNAHDVPRLTKLLVIDDICDGGRTFIELAKVIHEQCIVDQLGLFVTHGIFSKGFDELNEYYDYIQTTNTYHPNAVNDYRHDGVRDPKFFSHSVF